MQVRVKLMGSLKANSPADGALELAPSATIEDALAQLGLHGSSVQIVMLNGKPQPDRTRSLADGDELTVLPPVGGG
ncbi:MAG TPA: MoaD/ThiS family protein [Planctomycetaceae bacterium]|nr:MoaD/ThiS family protein [Planctomycetaceae bacterium]